MLRKNTLYEVPNQLQAVTLNLLIEWGFFTDFRLGRNMRSLRRVQADIAALMCVIHLQYWMSLQQQGYSRQVIREAFFKSQYRAVEHRKTGQRYAIQMRLGDIVKKLFAATGIRRSMTPIVL